MSDSTTLFTNTYSLYKTYTDEVCQWLFTTAGVPMEEDKSSQVSVPETAASRAHGRLKGKARKLAKAQAAAIPTKKSPNHSIPEAKISVNRLVDLVQQVASIPDKLSNVPKTIISKLKKAIELRRQYLALYSIRTSDANVSDPDLEAKNQGHAHFVHTLEYVLRTLQPPSCRNQPENRPITSDPPTSERDNRFDVLDIDEMDDDEDGTPVGGTEPSTTNQSSTHPRGNVQPKAVLIDVTDIHEIMFRIFCLFTDMHRLKIILNDHWRQYRAGSIDLETVASMTNLSISQIQHAERDLIEVLAEGQTLPKELGFAEMGMALFNQLSMARLGKVFTDSSGTERDPFNPVMADVVELTFFSIYMILKNFELVVQPRQIPWSIPGQLGVYDRNADRSRMSPERIMLHDRIILIELFSDFCALEYAKVSDEFHDEFTKGMRKLYNPNSPNIPVWLVFAADCFLMTHEILGDDIERPFEELERAARIADDNLNRFFESRRGQPSFELWPDSNTRNLRNFQTTFIRSTVLGDCVRELKAECKRVTIRRTAAERDVYNRIDLGPPNNFLKSHPILCGTLLFRLRLILQDVGCTIAGAWGTILYTSHAYNAFRQSGALDLEWPEMENFISTYGAQKIFAGFLPTNLEQSFKSFNLLMGTSLAHFASNARGRKSSARIRQCTKGPRDWSAKSPALEILTDWAQNHDPAGRPDPAGRLLARLMELNQPIFSGQSKVVGVVNEILAAKAIIENEMLNLKRDFVDLHLWCVDLLRGMRHELHEYFTKLIGPEYIENENQLCMMVGYILLISSHNHKVLQDMYKRQVPPNIRSFCIEAGARVMKESILAHTASAL